MKCFSKNIFEWTHLNIVITKMSDLISILEYTERYRKYLFYRNEQMIHVIEFGIDIPNFQKITKYTEIYST